MTEPRARAARHKGQLNFEQEIRQFLYAFGDTKDPLPETVRIVDEIITDYIIETCHGAARAAEVSGRQKIKFDDFRFAIRSDELATGRVKDLLLAEKELKESRKQFDVPEGKVGLERGTGKPGRRRKRKGPNAPEDDEDGDDDDAGGEDPDDGTVARGSIRGGNIGEDDAGKDADGDDAMDGELD